MELQMNMIGRQEATNAGQGARFAIDLPVPRQFQLVRESTTPKRSQPHAIRTRSV
jgi:hypothetical protein